VRKDYCEWDNDHIEKTLRKFVCSCEGFREQKHLRKEIKKRRSRNITRYGCCAKFVIALNYDTEQWYVKDFIDDDIFPTPSNAVVLGGRGGGERGGGGRGGGGHGGGSGGVAVVADAAAEAE
jgi:hypothetical protein